MLATLQEDPGSGFEGAVVAVAPGVPVAPGVGEGPLVGVGVTTGGLDSTGTLPVFSVTT